MTNDETFTARVKYSHLSYSHADVEINKAEYMEWLGLDEDDEFEPLNSNVQRYIEAGDPVFEVTGFTWMDEFKIEEVDCGV
jgi:hypothetical protein